MDELKKRFSQETIGKLANLEYFNNVDWMRLSPESYLLTIEKVILKMARMTGKSFDETLDLVYSSISTLNSLKQHIDLYHHFPFEIPKCRE